MRSDDPWKTENGQVDTNGEHDNRSQEQLQITGHPNRHSISLTM
jgi:hypothetical protein